MSAWIDVLQFAHISMIAKFDIHVFIMYNTCTSPQTIRIHRTGAYNEGSWNYNPG